MNKQARAERAHRKQLLIRSITYQREDLSAATDQWLQKTESFDRTWQTLARLRPLVTAGISLITVLSVRNPNRLWRWGQRLAGLWSVYKTLQKSGSGKK